MHNFDRILLSAFEFDVHAVIKESRYVQLHLQYNTIQYNTIQYNTIQYNELYCKRVAHDSKETDNPVALFAT